MSGRERGALLVGRLQGYYRFLIGLLGIPLAYVIPKDKQLAIFGAWGGKNYSDNPKYFMLWMREHTEMRCVWIGQVFLRDRVDGEFAVQWSWKSIWLCLRASLVVCNINYCDDLLGIPLRGKVFLYNAWHGIPLKKVGRHQLSAGGSVRITGWRHQLMWHFHYALTRQQAWTSVSSESMGNQMVEAWPNWFSDVRLIRAGLPRNDFLIQHCHDACKMATLKAKYAALLGLPEDKRWFLYLPTFRHHGECFSFSNCSESATLVACLEAHHAVLIEKQHPRVLDRLGQHNLRSMLPNVFLLSEQLARQVDVQELLLLSDRLITDYSSCYFDFALMGRPVLHFAYDYDAYASQDTGVYYALYEVCAGPVCATLKELLNWLAKPDEAFVGQQGMGFKDTVTFERGNASETVYRRFQAVVGQKER